MATVVALLNLCYTFFNQAGHKTGVPVGAVSPVGIHLLQSSEFHGLFTFRTRMIVMNEKIRAARLSIASNTVLTLAKLAAGLFMNSISVLSEAIHSGLDLVAALIAFVSVRESAKPADDRHPFGHGKFENVAGILEAVLILAAAAMIIASAYPKLRGEVEIHSLGLGAAIMGISALVNFFVSRELMRVARKTESPALAADAWHLRTDVYTSVGVFAGILAIKITGLTILDPLIAIGVTMLIVRAAVRLIIDSMRSILDVQLPETEQQIIREILEKYSSHYLEYHDLKTRKAGSQRFIVLHLVVPGGRAVNKVHELCDRIEEEICSCFKDANVLIHTEPCYQQCANCNQAVRQLPDSTADKTDCGQQAWNSHLPEK